MTNLLPGKFPKNREKNITVSPYKETITGRMVFFLEEELNRTCILPKLKIFLNLKKISKK
jgi:hypothetical protein